MITSSMRRVLTCGAAAAATIFLPAAVRAEAISSAYSDLSLDLKSACTQLSKAGSNEGDWSTFECPGYRDYKIYVMDDDLRRSINFGPDIDDPAWESFGAYNQTGSAIEWRLADEVPFATIQKWFVSGKEGQRATEVLVVEKVGHPASPGGCAVALVVATDNPKADEQARQAADTSARDFPCGKRLADRFGDVPDFGREKF